MHDLTVGDPRAHELMTRSACAGFPPAVAALARRFGTSAAHGDSCPPTAALDGSWEGTLAITARDKDRGHPQEPVRTRLTLAGDAVSVSVFTRGAWEEIKPAAFRVRRHKDSAVIHAVDDGWDNDGNWIETWVFSVTLVDHDHLRAVYHRIVNNVQADRQDDQAVWWYMAAGDLARVPGARP
jgi:hypothetical protein